jgi:hypothetical protein
MTIIVNDQVHLSEFRTSDKPPLIQHLNDRDIYDRTLRIPFPYTDSAADESLALVVKITQQQGRPVHFAIRNADASLFGGCGFDSFQAVAHRSYPHPPAEAPRCESVGGPRSSSWPSCPYPGECDKRPR